MRDVINKCDLRLDYCRRRVLLTAMVQLLHVPKNDHTQRHVLADSTRNSIFNIVVRQPLFCAFRARAQNIPKHHCR
jgi:hypothetical protein